MTTPKIFLIVGVLLFALSATEILRTEEETKKIKKEETRRVENAFRGIDLEAKAAYVYDVRGGKMLYGKNETVPLPLASLTKLMTALLAREAAPPETVVSISREALFTEGDTGLLVGEEWPLPELIGFTLTASSNDGAAAIAGALAPFLLDEDNRPQSFDEAMNRKARSLGFESMHFEGPTGLDTAGAAGGFGSAKDVSLLLLYLLSRYPETVEPTAYAHATLRSFTAPHAAENTNKEIGGIPMLLASKTGFTDLAGGNLSIAFEAGPGHPIIITVLGSSQDGRFEDMKKLVQRTLELPALIR